MVEFQNSEEREMQNTLTSCIGGNLSILSQEVSALLSPKSRKKKKAPKVAKTKPVFEVTRALLSDSSSDEGISTSDQSASDHSAVSSVTCGSLPTSDNEESLSKNTSITGGASKQDISVLSEEIDKLLVLKPKKKRKQKLLLEPIQESPKYLASHDVLPQQKATHNKRRKQPLGQRKVLSEISHLILSESGSDEQDKGSSDVCINHVSSGDDKENHAPKRNFSSQEAALQVQEPDCCKSDIKDGLNTTAIGDEIENSNPKNSGRSKEFQDQSHLNKDITAFIMSDSSSDEETPVLQCGQAVSDSGLNNKNETTSHLTDDDRNKDFVQHISNEQINQDSEKCENLDCVANSSSSFSDKNTSGSTTSSETAHSEQEMQQPIIPRISGHIQDMSVLSQEIGSLLMSKSEKKLRKKKKAVAIDSMRLISEGDDAANIKPKHKKRPVFQSRFLKQISELVLSDSASDNEKHMAVNTNSREVCNGAKNSVSRNNDSICHTSSPCLVPRSSLQKPQICDNREEVQSFTTESGSTTSSETAHSEQEMQQQIIRKLHPTNDQPKYSDVVTSKSVENETNKSSPSLQSNDCFESDFEAKDTDKLLESKDNVNPLFISSDDSDSSDGFLSVAASVKSSDQSLKSDRSRHLTLSDSSSDEDNMELYTTAFKHITPEKRNDSQSTSSSSEGDMLEEFFQKMKSNNSKTNTSGSSQQSHSMDSFVVSDNESLSGEEDNEFYLTTMNHQSREGSYEAHPFNKTSTSNYQSFRSDSASSYKEKESSNLFQTPQIHRLCISSDSEDDLPAALQKPVYFKTPLSTNITNMKTSLAKTKRCSFLVCLSDEQAGQHQKDCEAVKYLKHFKKHKEELTAKLFAMYNRTVFEDKLPADMSLQWNTRLLKTAGYCSYKRKVDGDIVSRTACIELSTKVCDTAERVRDTLIHEMCHAAVWILHGSKEAHGPIWKLFARKANRVHPEVPTISRCHDYSINTKFTYKCTGCSYEIGRHSKSLDTEKKVCGYCKSPFQLLLNSERKASSSRSVDMTPKTPRTPNAFALFVKENYGSVKKENKGISHKDLMNKLGQEYKTEKQKLSLS